MRALEICWMEKSSQQRVFEIIARRSLSPLYGYRSATTRHGCCLMHKNGVCYEIRLVGLQSSAWNGLRDATFPGVDRTTWSCLVVGRLTVPNIQRVFSMHSHGKFWYMAVFQHSVWLRDSPSSGFMSFAGNEILEVIHLTLLAPANY